MRWLQPVGEEAALLEVEPSQVHGWSEAVRAASIPGVRAVIPAAASLLILFDATQTNATRLDHIVGTLTPRQHTDTVTEAIVRIPARYDGPDLEAAAIAHGCSVEALIDWHTSRVWTAAFGGFAPGFFYLTTEQPSMIPRRDTPRARIPGGSVALAGAYSAVYPHESPGGWQIVGSTDAVMWDVQRDPPALLSVGARVQFERQEAASC